MLSRLLALLPVLIDEMDNPVCCTYGPAPNMAFLICTDGRILEQQHWYQPQQMEAAIAKYVEDNN
jgi:hypothetical protein